MGYPHIFKPLRLRHKELRNRIVFGAHTTNMAEDGLPGARHTAYYRERAMGGAAMIVVEPMPVHPAAVLTRGNFRPCSDDVIAPFRQMTQAAQAEGAVMIQQLYHVGAHGDWDNSWHAHWSPSGGPSYHDNDGSHEMTEDEIEETIAAFVAAARRCQQAGFDGVEVWAAYHCLLDQFWAPFSNRRRDQWGGSLENRTRLSRDILRRIRAACGEDFIVGLAVNDEPDSPVLPDHDEMVQDGHAVTIVTPDGVVARDLQRSATDGPARRTLAGLGVRFVVESAITRWHSGQGAEVVSLLTGRAEEIAADTLVLAAGVRADTSLAAALRTAGGTPILIGDALAPRNAAAAIHEGRKCALTL